MEHFSPSEKNWHLPQQCHLSWLEKSDVRHISHRAPAPPPHPPPPHLHLNLLTLHVLIFTVWFGVRLGPSAAQSSYGFKALHCLLNHNTNCPGSGLNKRFFFFGFQSLKSPWCIWSVYEAHCTWSSGPARLCGDYPSKWKAKVTRCFPQTVIDDSAVS